MPLLGPAVTSTDNNFSWLQAVVRGDHAELGVLDGHEYPLAACESPGTGLPDRGEIPAQVTAGLAASVKLARGPLLTELIECSGSMRPTQ